MVLNLIVSNYSDGLLRITADKREIKDFPKLPSTASFICKTLVAIATGSLSEILYNSLINLWL